MLKKANFPILYWCCVAKYVVINEIRVIYYMYFALVFREGKNSNPVQVIGNKFPTKFIIFFFRLSCRQRKCSIRLARGLFSTFRKTVTVYYDVAVLETKRLWWHNYWSYVKPNKRRKMPNENWLLWPHTSLSYSCCRTCSKNDYCFHCIPSFVSILCVKMFFSSTFFVVVLITKERNRIFNRYNLGTSNDISLQ